MPCHLILSKLADKCPSAVLAVLYSLVDPLQKTVTFRPKQDAVKQEVDRNEDMIRSALRAIASLNRISGYMRAEMDTEVLYRANTRVEAFYNLTKDCKDGISTC